MSDEERREEAWFRGTDELNADDLKSLVKTFWALAISVAAIIGMAIYGVVKWTA